MKSLLRFSLLFLCLLGITSFAQSQVVATGKVLNGTTGESIPGLSVFLLDDLGQRLPPEPNEQNVTTLEGEFTISDVLPDVWYTIEVYSGDILRFTNYVFVDSSVTSDNTVVLSDVIVDY
jgi:hypothetical protein